MSDFIDKEKTCGKILRDNILTIDFKSIDYKKYPRMLPSKLEIQMHELAVDLCKGFPDESKECRCIYAMVTGCYTSIYTTLIQSLTEKDIMNNLQVIIPIMKTQTLIAVGKTLERIDEFDDGEIPSVPRSFLYK